MSLQLAAKHLSTKGRGPDDTLVHMSRGEVKSLNDLAMAHGGSLTINPQTGLPEAGFLSMLLPVIAGAALGPAGYGLSAGMTAALVGGGSYLLNPKAGLMGALSAGMGAYGGAGLGDALAQQGMQQATAEELAKSQAGISNVVGNAGTQGLPAGISPDQYAKNVLAQTQPYVDARTAAQTAFDAGSFTDKLGTVGQGAKTLTSPGGLSNLSTNLGGPMGTARTALSIAAPALLQEEDAPAAPVVDKDMGQRYSYSPGVAQPLPAADVPTYEDMLTKQGNFGSEQNYYPTRRYAKVSKDEAKNIYGFAGGGPVEMMSNNAAMGANTMYPMANMATSSFATPYQTPQSTNMLANMAPSGGGAVNMMSGEPSMQGTRMAEGGETTSGYTYDPQTQRYTGIMSSAPMMPTGAEAGIGTAMGMTYDPSTQRFTGGGGGGLSSDQIYLGGGQYGPNAAARKAAEEAAAAAASSSDSGNGVSGDSSGMASGGLSDARYNLGGYSDGGRLLRGPGDGVSDSIPAMIGKKQPARLADGEFVVPARIVSEIGNGSTEAGARKLYGMMDRVQAARRQTVGKGKVAKNSRADKYLPA